MNDKRTRQINEIVPKVVPAGEEVQLASICNVGTVSLRKQATVAAVAGILSAGTVVATARPRQLYFVLTNQRLLFLGMAPMTGAPTAQVAFQVPRAAIIETTGPNGAGFLKKSVELTVNGLDKTLQLVFPKPVHDDCAKLAAALGASDAR